MALDSTQLTVAQDRADIAAISLIGAGSMQASGEAARAALVAAHDVARSANDQIVQTLASAVANRVPVVAGLRLQGAVAAGQLPTELQRGGGAEHYLAEAK